MVLIDDHQVMEVNLGQDREGPKVGLSAFVGSLESKYWWT